MTVYYIDADNGSDANNGLGPDSGAVTDKPWLTLDQFTENARSAGDIAILRRGTTAQYDNGTALTVTSDGNKDNPIIIQADYYGSSARGLHGSDDWNGGDQFATSAQTYTLVFGSKTHTASATITGISAGDWIANDTDGDDRFQLSYEVASVSGTTLTLHLPYKGSAGSTKTLMVMPAAPVWGDVATSVGAGWSSDHNWLVQGIHWKSDSTVGTVGVTNSYSFFGLDCIIESGGAVSTEAFAPNFASVVMKKCRFDGGVDNIRLGTGIAEFYNCLGENATTKSADTGGASVNAKFVECEFDNDLEFGGQATNPGGQFRLINNNLNSVAPSGELTPLMFAGASDHEGTRGNSVLYSALNQATTTPVVLTQEETTTVRSGGSNTSIKVTPGSASTFSTAWELSAQLLLEVPFYVNDTSSHTYSIYMRPTLTTDWTADPTASELWWEMELWGHASNNFRKITKSTGTIDMNGSTAWQALSVTVSASQTGLGWGRLYYAKPVESTKANSFFIDPNPVIT